MRLLNAKSYAFEEFYGHATPPYAILSHTWQGSGEVTHQQWLALTEEVQAKSGFRKIRNACTQALVDGHNWIWIDTNCIDKFSSAELSEAINSMFAWYRDAAICYVYLDDVPPIGTTTLRGTTLWQDNVLKHFRASRWWTRGWTLQELLAPGRLEFFASDWSHIGSRDVLASCIQRMTGIETSNCQSTLQEASVARKMSWLSQRQTTRVEDMAYCMLGLFDINMPLLYGEGPKAFTRLQEEIIKRTADVTIFCWTHDESTPRNWLGLLAPNPRAFAHSGNFYLDQSQRLITPWSITNLGLSISLPVFHTFDGAFLCLYGVGTKHTEERGQIVTVPISARDQVWHGHYRLTYPPGPVIFSSKTWLYALPNDQIRSKAQPFPKLRLSPTHENLKPVFMNRLIQRLEKPILSQNNSLLLLIHEHAPKFLATHVADSNEPPSAAGEKRYINDFIAAPSALSANAATGLVTLVKVTMGMRYILAGAVELISTFGTSPDNTDYHVRIFLAFEPPNADTKMMNQHYCAISCFTTTPEKAMHKAKTRAARTLALEGWYNQQLEEVYWGHAAHQPELVVDQSGSYALRVLTRLAETGNCALITVVLVKPEPWDLRMSAPSFTGVSKSIAKFMRDFWWLPSEDFD
ncbi:HET domain-containing protein [Microdochium nivale]|nr:HET domain-containing protein [Microdochium nivale]